MRGIIVSYGCLLFQVTKDTTLANTTSPGLKLLYISILSFSVALTSSLLQNVSQTLKAAQLNKKITKSVHCFQEQD